MADAPKKTRWISMAELEQTGKTKRWVVNNVQVGPIGHVKWSTGFRRYAFYPEPDTHYEEGCLRDIAEFLEVQTALHKDTYSDADREHWQQLMMDFVSP